MDLILLLSTTAIQWNGLSEYKMWLDLMQRIYRILNYFLEWYSISIIHLTSSFPFVCLLNPPIYTCENTPERNNKFFSSFNQISIQNQLYFSHFPSFNI